MSSMAKISTLSCCLMVSLLMVDSAWSLQSPPVVNTPTLSSRATSFHNAFESRRRRHHDSNSHWLGGQRLRFSFRLETIANDKSGDTDGAKSSVVDDVSPSTSRAREKKEAPCSSALTLPTFWKQLKQDSSSLPPWLARYASSTPDEAEKELAWLLQSIEQRISSRYLVDRVRTCIENIPDPSIAVGCCGFVQTLIQVHSSSSTVTATGSNDDDNGVETTTDFTDLGELVLAAIPHYVQCINLRGQQQYQQGDTTNTLAVDDDRWSRLAGHHMMEPIEPLSSASARVQQTTSTSSCDLVWTTPQKNGKSGSSSSGTVEHFDFRAVERLVEDAAKIKRTEVLAGLFLGAGAPSTIPTTGSATATTSNGQATNMLALQSLLLSVTGDDVRALVLRCVACLFRLQGILQCNGGSGSFRRMTPELRQTAKQGLSVYAVLAQRLGLPQLKAQIENAAFSILYQRQYQAVTSLYYGQDTSTAAEGRQALQTIANFLVSDLHATIQRDSKLVEQLEDWQVACRVKEPYSFWKKLLQKRSKRRLKAAASLDTAVDGDAQDGGLAKNATTTTTAASLVPLFSKPDDTTTSDDDSNSLLARSGVHQAIVTDVVGLRVILKARKWHPDEDEETTRARERLLCYYVQKVLIQKWGGATRIKDYIQSPKPNGYQSLHHTSVLVQTAAPRTSGMSGIVNSTNGFEIPFEVQVRSEEMHQKAEFGMASHWTYKLGGSSSSSSSSSQEESVPCVVDTTTEVDELSTATKKKSLLLPSSSTARKAHRERMNETVVVAAKSTTRPVEESEIKAPSSGRGEEATTTESYLDALITAKDALKQNIYVFMASPDRNGDHEDGGLGQLLLLPRNAQIQDAIVAAMETGVTRPNSGNQSSSSSNSNSSGDGAHNDNISPTRTVWRNGRVASLEELVENGDVLLVTQ